MMRAPAGHHVLRLLGGLCATAGFIAWVALAWKASSSRDGVTPQGDEGGRLLVWGLTGTVLMIVGAVLLHFAVDAVDRHKQDERTPPR
jgi:hypothetical protein